MIIMDKKFEIQSKQYIFQYHYLVDINNKKFNKSLSWGVRLL